MSPSFLHKWKSIEVQGGKVICSSSCLSKEMAGIQSLILRTEQKLPDSDQMTAMGHS